MNKTKTYNADKARKLIGLQVKFKYDGLNKWGDVVAYDEERSEYTIRIALWTYKVSPSQLVGVYIPEVKDTSGLFTQGYTVRNK